MVKLQLLMGAEMKMTVFMAMKAVSTSEKTQKTRRRENLKSHKRQKDQKVVRQDPLQF
jgi:hypothetical protein